MRRARLSGGYWRFHDCQDVAALLGDTPSTFQPLDEILGENRQTRYASREVLGPLGPVPPAGGENGHVTLQVRQACEAIRIAHQNLENCDLEIHLVDRSANQLRIASERNGSAQGYCLYRKGRISLDDMYEAGVDSEIAEYVCRSIGRYHVFDVRASLR